MIVDHRASLAAQRVLIGIPTKDRPEYLSGLLGSIMFQHHTTFDVLIVDTGEEREAEEDTQVQRFTETLRGLGHDVVFIRGVSAGCSSVVPTNRILVEAEDRGYDWVFKVDDDHVMPPDTLTNLLQAARVLEIEKAPILVSGVTPWMHRAWEGAASPDDPVKLMDEHHVPVTDIWLEPYRTSMAEGYRHRVKVGHFDKYSTHAVVRTKLASAANFLMRPDTRVLWSDISGRCLLADAVWFLQLQKFLGYQLYFETGVWVWHVTAPSGGTRTGQEDHIKGGEPEEALRRRQLDRVLEKLEMGRSGMEDE